MEATTGALKLGRFVVGHRQAAGVCCFTFMLYLTSFLCASSRTFTKANGNFRTAIRQSGEKEEARTRRIICSGCRCFFFDDPYPHCHMLCLFSVTTLHCFILLFQTPAL